MQTFLPYASFKESAQCLDYRRLGKQRVEAAQIHRALTDPTYGWQHHPATQMWRGYADALAQYHNIMITEWVQRGYRNTMSYLLYPDHVEMPPWLGNADVHFSHQAALAYKLPEHYNQFGWERESKFILRLAMNHTIRKPVYYWPTSVYREDV